MARTLEHKLAELRADPTAARVRDALRSQSGILIAAAAKHVGDRGELIDELAGTFERLIGEIKRDPGCRGKVAIARVLHDLERWEDAVFARGVRCVQIEPGYAESLDTAGELRAICAMAYAHFARPDALDVLAELLADDERNARIGAAKAIGDCGRPDGSALLRFKLLADPDPEPEVLAACFESLLHLGDHLDFVVRMLDDADERAEAAALALAQTRDPRAIDPLVTWCQGLTAADRGRVGYLALALLRLEPATVHLLEIVRDASPASALSAAKALATFKDDPALAACLREAAAKRDRAFRAEIEAVLV